MRFALCGGESAVRDAARLANSLLSQLPEVPPETISRLTHQEFTRTRSLQVALRSSLSPETSSLGRLMEGIAWIVLGLESSGYIDEPAVRLDAACDPRASGAYRWRIDDRCEPWELDWRPVLRTLLDDIHRGETPSIIAERFHRGIVDCILDLRVRCPALLWVFSGGVFQNRRLCELLAERWPLSGPPLGLPGAIHPNDGGLAAGQLAILSAQWTASRTRQSTRQPLTQRGPPSVVSRPREESPCACSALPGRLVPLDEPAGSPLPRI